MENQKVAIKSKKPYRMPTFQYSRTKYNCYILYGAYDHKLDKKFTDKLRDLSEYCPYRGFEELRTHFNDSKKEITHYVNEKILHRVSEDVISGKFDKGRDVKNWTSLLQRQKTAEFIPIGKLIDEYIQFRYQLNETKANMDCYKNALTSFKDSLRKLHGEEFSVLTITDIQEHDCNKIFDNWEKYKTDWSDNTRKTYRAKVRVFFDNYISIIRTNPVTRNSRIKSLEKVKNIPLTKFDFDKIISHLQKSDKRKYKELLGFCWLMYYGLLRGDTMYQIKCGHIKFEDKDTYNVQVYSNMVKNKVAGRVTIPKGLIDYFISAGIYDSTQPEKLLFPPLFKPRVREGIEMVGKPKQNLRNRQWASNLWNYVLREELGYSREFTKSHNIYCLKATGALNLLDVENWDIREISAQMLHSQLSTTWVYIQKLNQYFPSTGKRQFEHSFLEKFGKNLTNEENSPQNSNTILVQSHYEFKEKNLGTTLK